jgi:hypothetical protein
MSQLSAPGGSVQDLQEVPDHAALARLLAAEPPATIEDVVARLQAIEPALPPGDGVAWFAKLYLEVTRSVGTALIPATFRDPAFLLQLDLAFAGLFFDALGRSLRKPPATPKAWAPLIEARATRGIAPIQFALAGMNAHINRDLPIALVKTCEQRRIELRAGSPQHRDFCKVNALLVRVEAKVKTELVTDALAHVDVALGELDDVVAMWNVERARDAAWVNAEALWALRDLPHVRAEFETALDRFVGFAGRGLLRPLASRQLANGGGSNTE